MSVTYNTNPSLWPDEHRECLCCQTVKEFSCFSKHKKSYRGHASTCKDCRRAQYTPKARKTTTWPTGNRPCTLCGEMLSLDHFGPLKHGPFGKNTGCKKCRNAQSKTEHENYSTEYRMYLRAMQRAKLNDREFSIVAEDIIIPAKCPVLNEPMICGGKYAPSLDRIDSSKGYVKDNIQVISRRANLLKSNASLTEIEALYNFLKRARD